MTQTPAHRRLLVVSEPAPWIPQHGFHLGSCILDVERFSILDETAEPPIAGPWDVVAFDSASLGDSSPATVMEILRRIAPEATFLPISNEPDPREALYYLKHGAFEYLEAPLNSEDFLRALSEAIENRDTFQEILDLNQTLEEQKEQLLQEKLELERVNRELEAVSRLARSLASTIDLNEAVSRLAESILETVDCSRLLLGTVDPEVPCEQTVVHLVAEGGQLRPTDEKIVWQLDEVERNKWMRTVYHEAQPLVIDDPKHHPLTAGTPVGHLHKNPLAKIPMAIRGRVVGTITVESCLPGQPFSSEDLELLRIFADTAAMALENARLYHSMRELSVRDELTGLYNRRHLMQQFEAEWIDAERRSTPLSVLMLDIDHFKQLNDGNNHVVGDAALRKLSTTLLRNTRGVDTVARYGGEEFVILLPRTPVEVAGLVAEKLRRIVEETEFPGEEVVPGGTLTISVGIAAYPSSAQDRRELLEWADRALYQAKQMGRNRVQVWDGEHHFSTAADPVCCSYTA